MVRVRPTALALILALAIILPLGIEGISLLRISRAAEENVRDVEKTYEDVLDRRASLLAESPLLTQAQQESLADIRRVRMERQEGQSIEEKLTGITELQQALMQLFAYSSGTPLGASAELAALQRETGKAGVVQPSIDRYNETAQRWNRSLVRPTGMVFARIRKLEPLHLLRFDGIVEFSTTVSL